MFSPVTRRWVFHGVVHMLFGHSHLWSFFQEVRSGSFYFVTLRFLLYYPAFAVLRPRVGSIFPGQISVPSV